jgi:RNA polymerase sigma factor (sigma-70 family)
MAFKGDLEDFGGFYERAYPQAYRVALGITGDRALADDVAQEAFARAFRDRSRFRGDAPGSAWIHRIVVNEALDALRRRRWTRSLDAQVVELAVRPDGSAAVADRLSIEGALAGLAPKQRAAVVLRYYVDMDYATIASVLGTTAGNVGVMLTRSLDRLRNQLEPGATGDAAVDPAQEVSHGR